MARKSFFSFHYVPDNWRASKVRNMGMIEGNQAVSDNDWETVTKGGEAAIKKWIDDQMVGRSCVVVLIGSNTAKRKWIDYEIIKGWNDRKGVVGIHIHNLTDRTDNQTSKGSNPFSHITVTSVQKPMSGIVKCYDPPYSSSVNVYNNIKENIAGWVEEAIKIRSNY